MIRVNLLPQKRDRKAGGSATRSLTTAAGPGQTWILVVFALVIVEVLGLVVFEKMQEDELAQIQDDNRKIEASIKDIKDKIANQAEVKAQLKALRDREEAIARLESARTGPTAVLLELSHVLTAGRGPTADHDKIEQLRHDNPGAAPNAAWDTRRLWLTKYLEADRTVKISGQAKDGEDVSEFLRRLSLSDYFFDLKLLPATKTIDAATKLELVQFELSAKVRY